MKLYILIIKKKVMDYEKQLREGGGYTELEIQGRLEGCDLHVIVEHINTLSEDRIYCNEREQLYEFHGEKNSTFIHY